MTTNAFFNIHLIQENIDFCKNSLIPNIKNKYIELMNKKSDFFNLRKYIVNYASCFMKMKQEIDDLIIYAVKNDFVSREYVSKTKVVPFMYYNKIIEKITSYNYKENI